MESSDNCDDGLYHKVLLLLAVVRFLQCDYIRRSQLSSTQVHTIYTIYICIIHLQSTSADMSPSVAGLKVGNIIPSLFRLWIFSVLLPTDCATKALPTAAGASGMVTAGSLLLLLAAVSLVPNVSLCCCLNLQCNTITRLLEAGRSVLSVLSDRTVSTVPPLASYWPRRGWICLHTNITLQHYITALHYNITLHYYMRVPGPGVWVSLCDVVRYRGGGRARRQEPRVMETRSCSLLVVSVRSGHGLVSVTQRHVSRVTLSLATGHHLHHHQPSL